MKNNLTELQLSLLKETLNIGGGHAALALSQMINRKIMIAVVRSGIMPSEDFLKDVVGHKNENVVSVYLQTLGDAKGAIMFMFSRENALKLIDLLRGQEPGKTKFLDETSEGVIKELGSILTGAFFTVISDMFKIKFFHNIPCYSSDTAEAIMYGVCEKIFGDKKERLCLATEFIESHYKITGSFAYVPEDDTIEKFLSSAKNSAQGTVHSA